jgi:hypothetical protein
MQHLCYLADAGSYENVSNFHQSAFFKLINGIGNKNVGFLAGQESY